MIVDREEEIKAFVPEEYWTLARETRGRPAAAVHRQTDDRRQEGRGHNGEEARASTVPQVGQVRRRQGRAQGEEAAPAPPFITSRLQRGGARNGFSVKRTMRSPRSSTKARRSATAAPSVSSPTCVPTRSASATRPSTGGARIYRREIRCRTLPEKPNVYLSKAAGAGRPRGHPPDDARIAGRRQGPPQGEEYNLYKLIWDRFVASQMKPGPLRRHRGRHRERPPTRCAPRAKC